MAHKCITFRDELKTLSISQLLETGKIYIEAAENDDNNPYAPFLSFDLDYDDVSELIEWLQKQKTLMEDK